MLSRRRFLGCGAAGAAAAIVPTLIVPKARAVAATVETRAERRRRFLIDREVERLYDEEFATSLTPGSKCVAFLWCDAGHGGYHYGSSLRIEKEIWCDIGGRWHEERCRLEGLDPETTDLSLQFVNFHLFNYVDSSKAHTPWSGCRTHSCDEPYLDLRDALRQAVVFTAEAVQGGKWKRVGQDAYQEMVLPDKSFASPKAIHKYA